MKITLKIKPGAIPLKLISDLNNALKITIPRRFDFSGHFHLNTPRICLKALRFETAN